MISHEHKFIFVHIPKCAGCSLKEHLKENCGNELINSDHHSLDAIFRTFGPQVKDYYKFTFVRNPWDRIVSLYSFWLNQTPNSVFYQWDFEQVNFIKNNNLSFNDFVKLIPLNNSVFHEKPHLLSYIGHFIKSPSSLDFIGRIENFQEDLVKIFGQIGIKMQKDRWSNKSKHKHYSEYYNNETRDIIAKQYSKDIEYFGYEFGE